MVKSGVCFWFVSTRNQKLDSGCVSNTLLPCSFYIFLIFEKFKDLIGSDWSVLLCWVYKDSFQKEELSKVMVVVQRPVDVRWQKRTSLLSTQSGVYKHGFKHSPLWYKPTWMVTYLGMFSASPSLPHPYLSDGCSAKQGGRNELSMYHSSEDKKTLSTSVVCYLSLTRPFSSNITQTQLSFENSGLSHPGFRLGLLGVLSCFLEWEGTTCKLKTSPWSRPKTCGKKFHQHLKVPTF